jgi:hypothetical protein
MEHYMTEYIVAVFETASAAEPLQRASERQHSLLRDPTIRRQLGSAGKRCQPNRPRPIHRLHRQRAVDLTDPAAVFIRVARRVTRASGAKTACWAPHGGSRRCRTAVRVLTLGRNVTARAK